MQQLLNTLQSFDGKQTKRLADSATAILATKANIEMLLALAEHEDANLRLGATWVLKHWQDSGTQFSAAQVGRMVRLLKEETQWGAQLQLLQMLDGCGIPLQSANKLFSSAKALANSKNKFVRAWAVNAVVHLANEHELHRDAALALIAVGECDEAASVKARIRNIRKRYKWASA